MRSFLIFLTVLVVGCTGSQPTQHQDEMPVPLPAPSPANIHLEDYATPFGHSPDRADLQTVFLALPDALVADMSVANRHAFIDINGSDNPVMYDPTHKYLTYYNDNPYEDRASSIFYLKIFPSSRYQYVVLVHMVKPSALNTAPADTNTFVLAPVNSQWLDITNNVLPKEVRRDWVFQPLRSSQSVEAGPYQQSPQGHWTFGSKEVDLTWHNDHFTAERSRSNKFTD